LKYIFSEASQALYELAIGVEGFARYPMGGGEGCFNIDGFTFGCMLRWHSADCWLEC
jgi:hypothetical protein